MGSIIVNGYWKEGVVLDYHVSSSTPLGFNEYGHMDFETVRTQLGEVVYKIKYKGFTLNNQGFIELIKLELDEFLSKKKISYIIGAPPSNKFRQHQPVDMIGEALSEYMGIPYLKDFFVKTDNSYVKNLAIDEKKEIINTIVYNEGACNSIEDGSDILLIDDIYQSGSTLNACTRKLLDDSFVNNVFVMALTKTRNG